MKPAPFTYHRAHSAEEAMSLLAGLGDDAKLIAGGQSLVAMMKELHPDEMIVEVYLPAPQPNAAISEFARRHGDLAIVAVAAAVGRDGGICRDARLVLGGVAGTVRRASDAEATLPGSGLGAGAITAAAEAAAEAAGPPSDLHGSAGDRRHLIRVLTARALREATANA